MAGCARLPLLTANLMLTLAIPLAHLAFLTGDPADGTVSEATLIARLREQFAFLGPGVTVTIRDGIAHISLPPAAAAKADEATKLYERAGKRAREGDFARAVELYQRVLTLNPALPSKRHARPARLADADVRTIALEVALAGQEGLDYASPDKNYTLRALPGEAFSGLELMCLMHAGFKRLAPGEDTGMNLDEPFLTALELFNGESRKT